MACSCSCAQHNAVLDFPGVVDGQFFVVMIWLKHTLGSLAAATLCLAGYKQ